MGSTSTQNGLLIAAAIGIVVWLAIGVATGSAEAWDHAAYWGLGFPALMFSCAALGWFFPENAWRLGLVASIAQAIPMLIGGRSSGLLPFGLIVLVVLALPLSLAAFLAARARIRHDLRSIRNSARGER